MALFARRRDPETRSVSLAQLQKVLDRSGITWSGVVVDDDRAMRNSAVWASIELVASLTGSLPIDQFRRDADGRIVAMPAAALFTDPDPDPSVTISSFIGQLMRSAVPRGNGYAMLASDPLTGRVSGATTIHPDRVRWHRDADGRWVTLVDNQPVERWPLGPLWHFALYQQPGSPIGLSPIEYHRQTIGSSIAAQKFGAQFFDSGGNPSLILRVPEEPTPDESAALKRKVLDTTRGNRDPLILPTEIVIERPTIPPDDSQFLETQRYGTEEIARIFLGGFPELIGSAVTGGGSITYANREQRMADFITLSLSPRYLVPLERALSALLPADQFVRFNFDALLRADLAGRYASYKTASEVSAAMGRPLLTIDEMRALENLPPLPAPDDDQSDDVDATRDQTVAETVQKVYLGVGKVITSDEARAIINSAGGALPIPGPVFPTDTAPAAASERATRLDSGPAAVICDIDGTLLDDDDQPIRPVIDYVNGTIGQLFIVSGRLESDADATRASLRAAGLRQFTMMLRPYVEKSTMLHKQIVAGELLAEYDIRLAIDNDADTRAMYDSLGIETVNPRDIGTDDDAGIRAVLRAVDLTMPQYMIDAAARGIELFDDGFGGDGLAAETITDARGMARGEISEAKVLRANAWAARHAVDLDASKNSDPTDPEWPGAGAVAHYLWAIDPLDPEPARQWFADRAAEIQQSETDDA